VVDKLKVGEVSAPALFTDRGKQDYRIYYLKARTDPHKATIEEDYNRIQNMALEKKKLQTIDEWIARRLNTTYISISEGYRYCAFQRKWIKN
jgi:peptidyl-prolyl cis-trans isomerase SurA